MKRSSTSVAKLLLVLSIAIATVSVFKGLEWQRSVKGLTTQLGSVQASEQQARKQAAELSQVLPGDEAALPLTPTLVSVIATLTQSQVENRISIAPLAPALAANNTSVDLLEHSQSVGNTPLRTFTLQIRGTYKEYEGLRRYLNQLQKHPVSLTRLSIAGNTFELDVKVYGTV